MATLEAAPQVERLGPEVAAEVSYWLESLGIQLLAEAELAELRSRGVEIQEYDMPELKTVDGVADLGFALMAWIVDPHGNALAIVQLKE